MVRVNHSFVPEQEEVECDNMIATINQHSKTKKYGCKNGLM